MRGMTEALESILPGACLIRPTKGQYGLATLCQCGSRYSPHPAWPGTRKG